MYKQPIKSKFIFIGSEKFYFRQKHVDLRSCCGAQDAKKIMSEGRCERYRICKSSFKVKFGNLSGKQFYSSSQNLFKQSQRKDSFGIVLVDVCRQVGLVFLEDPEVYSDCVCNHCGRKILNLGHLFE